MEYMLWLCVLGDFKWLEEIVATYALHLQTLVCWGLAVTTTVTTLILHVKKA